MEKINFFKCLDIPKYNFVVSGRGNCKPKTTREGIFETLINSYQDAMNFWRAMGNERRYREAKQDLNDVLEFRYEEMMQERQE